MPPILLDTHAWVWSFADTTQLSPRAHKAILEADAVYVSPITFFEIGQKVRVGKWPEMIPHVRGLAQILHDQGGLVAPFTPEICLHASLHDWAHRDPFDRLIAATAEVRNLTLISKDPMFRTLAAITTRW